MSRAPAAWLVRLAWLEPFWVLGIGAALTLPGRIVPLALHPYLLAALFLGWPLRRLAYRRFFARSPVDWSLAFLLLWLPVNVWASADRTVSWIAAGYFLFGMALCIALLNWPPAQSRPQLVAWFLLSIAGVLAVVSPPLVVWKTEFRVFRLPQIYGFFQAIPIDVGETIHANVLAGVMVIALPLFLSLILRRGWAPRGWLLLTAGTGMICLLMLVLSQSRGGYLAAAVALPLVVALRWPRLFYATPVALVLLIGAIFQMGVERTFELLGSSSTFGGYGFRIEVWTNALYALSDFVFTGIGIGTFDLVVPLLYPYPTVDGTAVPHAHNLFLQIGVDLGLPGLIVYLALMINVLVLLLAVLRRRPQPLAWALAAGAVGGFVAMFVHGILDAVTWGTKLAFFPWLLVALAVLLHRRGKDDNVTG